MGKLLRVMAVLLFLLSIAALILTDMLFKQREMLKGRAHLLEEKMIDLAATFESERATVDVKPTYPARDIDECTADVIDSPNRSDFWNSYSYELEVLDVPTLDLRNRREDLKSYYLRNEFDGSIVKDKLTGRKITTGEHTMDAVLKEIIARAEDQLVLLNETRQQLIRVRRELVNTIDELNSTKGKLRGSLNDIVQRDETIGKLNGDIRDLKDQISALEDRIRGLRDTIADQKNQLEEKTDKVQGNRDEIARLEEEIKKLRPHVQDQSTVVAMPRGLKGVVEEADSRWNFVVIKLTPAFLSELTADPSRPMPQPVLIIKRNRGGESIFVAKARLSHIREDESLGVAEVMTDWQDSPIAPGDEVFF